MALGNFDELLSKLDETDGNALPFSLLGIQQPEQQAAAPPSVFNTPAPQEPKTPGVFDAVSGVVGGINKARESGVKLGQDLAKGIREGIGGIFGQEPSKEKTEKKKPRTRTVSTPALTAAPPLAAPPLQGGSVQLPQAQAPGTNRIQQILDQQLEFRNKIRSGR